MLQCFVAALTTGSQLIDISHYVYVTRITDPTAFELSHHGRTSTTHARRHIQAKLTKHSAPTSPEQLDSCYVAVVRCYQQLFQQEAVDSFNRFLDNLVTIPEPVCAFP